MIHKRKKPSSLALLPRRERRVRERGGIMG
jgi:hypothetical protein